MVEPCFHPIFRKKSVKIKKFKKNERPELTKGDQEKSTTNPGLVLSRFRIVFLRSALRRTQKMQSPSCATKSKSLKALLQPAF
jgi:hypothetical protein